MERLLWSLSIEDSSIKSNGARRLAQFEQTRTSILISSPFQLVIFVERFVTNL